MLQTSSRNMKLLFSLFDEIHVKFGITFLYKNTEELTLLRLHQFCQKAKSWWIYSLRKVFDIFIKNHLQMGDNGRINGKAFKMMMRMIA